MWRINNSAVKMQIFIEALATSELTNTDAYKCR